jgi:hypothetical protein
MSKTPWSFPDDPILHAALGRLAIAHTQLELILRYCVKVIADQDIQAALDATEGERISDLRERVKRLFKERQPTALEKNQLDALLGRAKLFSEERNTYLHSVFSETPEGRAIMKDANHRWGPAPSESAIDDVTKGILRLAKELNDARLNGFIKRVVARHKALKLP